MEMARGGVKRSRQTMELSTGHNKIKCGRKRSLIQVDSNSNSNSRRDRPAATGGAHAAVQVQVQGTGHHDDYQIQNVMQCRDYLFGLQFIVGDCEDDLYDDKIMALPNQKVIQFYRCLRLIEKNTANESKTAALQKLFRKVCKVDGEMIKMIGKKKYFEV